MEMDLGRGPGFRMDERRRPFREKQWQSVRSRASKLFLAPLSIEFSTNSFTTDTGPSTTSPAAILSIVSWLSKLIFPIILQPYYDIHTKCS